jgi:ubiquinone/menaquinone biosynthesis C-methylase UbiE
MSKAEQHGPDDWRSVVLPMRRPHQPAVLHRLYDRAASSWHAMILRLGYLDAYRDLVAAAERHMGIGAWRPELAVLDVGSGTGGFALALAGRIAVGHRLDLLDVSDGMLAKAASQLEAAGFPASTIHGDLSVMQGRRATYDIVLAAHVIEHFDDAEAGLHEMAQLLKPGGLLLLVVSKPHWCNTLVWLRWRHKVFPEAVVVGALSGAGFMNVHVHRFGSGPPGRTSLGFAAVFSGKAAV